MRRSSAGAWFSGLVLGIAAAGAGCGAGSAAILAGTSDTGGNDANRPPAIGALELSSTRTSPATVAFTLIDADADALDVSLEYEPAPGIRLAMTLVGAATSLSSLPSAGNGARTEREWDFAADLGSEALRAGLPISVTIVRANGAPPSALDATETRVAAVGNDAPVVDRIVVPAPGVEVTGVALVELRVSDSSGDSVDVTAEFNAEESAGFPEAGWRRATPAAGATPSGLAFERQPAAPLDENGEGGTQLAFFWDVIADLGSAETGVLVRFRAQEVAGDEPSAASRLAESAVFRVDNNSISVATLDGGALAFEPDQRRAIPIPFTVVDPEADDVGLVLQWRRSDQAFDSTELVLPSAPGALAALLLDPARRREKQVATEVPVVLAGPVRPDAALPPDGMWLPELSTSLAAESLVGRPLEILRASRATAPLPAGHLAGLSRPVGAIVREHGRCADVLHGSSGWRLTRFDLASGADLGTLASGPGEPTALASDPDGAFALVGSVAQGAWRLDQVELPAGRLRASVGALDAPSVEPGPIRGVAWRGLDSALITLGSSLVQVCWAGDGERASTLLGPPGRPLAGPHGLAVDPSRPERAFVAVQDGGGTVLEVDTLRGVAQPIHLEHDGAGLPLPSPAALALEGNRRLLVVTRPDPGRLELRELDLGGGRPGLVATVAALELQGEDPLGGISVDGEGARAWSLPGRGTLAIGGGIEQRRTIVAVPAELGQLRVDRAFEPPLGAGRAWRIPRFLGATERTPEGFAGGVTGNLSGASGVFVWNSADAQGAGEVLFKLTPFDTEVGIASETAAPTRVLLPIEREPVYLGSDFGGSAKRFFGNVVVGDFDADGRLDLARVLHGACTDSACADRRDNLVEVFLQTDPGVLGAGQAAPTCPAGVSLGAGASFTLGEGELDRPARAAAGDVDGDGATDLVVANSSSRTASPGSSAGYLTLHLQDPLFPGRFLPAIPLGAGVLANPTSVVIADLDGDGDADLACADQGRDELVVLRQESGSFAIDPADRIAIPGTSAQITPETAVSVVEAGDLDQDGRLDLAVAAFEGDALVLLRQDAQGRFAAQTLADPLRTRRPEALVVKDLDGDGDLDLACANRDSTHGLAVFRNEGGTLVLAQTGNLDPLTPGKDRHGLAAADVDEDGDVDLLATNQNVIAIQIFLQDAGGRFGTSSDPAEPSTRMAIEEQFFALGTADLDVDGGLDLIASSNNSCRDVTIYFHVGAGRFSVEAQARLGGPDTTGDPRAIAVGDLDEDGLPDLVSGHTRTDDFLVHHQTRPRVFRPDPRGPFGGPAGGGESRFPVDLALADVDRDGRADVVSCQQTSATLTVFRQRADGGFGTADTPPRPDDVRALGLAGAALAAADLDGDGDIDVLTVQRGDAAPSGPDPADPGDVRVFANDGAGLAQDPEIVGAGSLPFAQDLVLADLDRDGLLDLVVACRGRDAREVFLQRPTGGFEALPDQSLGDGAGRGPSCVVAADLDLDGRYDVASGEDEGASISVFYQSEDGVLGAAGQPDLLLPVRSTATNPNGTPVGVLDLVAHDLDRDLAPDLLAAGPFSHSVFVFRQSARRAFFRQQELNDLQLSICRPFRIAAADVDRDTDPDVVVCSTESCQSVQVLYGSHGR